MNYVAQVSTKRITNGMDQLSKKLTGRLNFGAVTVSCEVNSMPFYIQRRANGKIETIDELDDSKEAHRLAREYNLADQSAFHYVARHACKGWRTK